MSQFIIKRKINQNQKFKITYKNDLLKNSCVKYVKIIQQKEFSKYFNRYQETV